MFESRVLRRIFGPKRDEVPGEWNKLHNEEFNNLYFPPSVVQGIKSRRVRWAGARNTQGRGEAYTEFWQGKLRERDHLEGPGVGGRILL